MSVLVFDTHDFFKRLHSVGFSEAQAEVLICLQQASINTILSQVHNAKIATQAPRETEVALKHNLREMELKLELKIADTKSELVRWIVGAGFLQTALITALLLKVSSRI